MLTYSGLRLNSPNGNSLIWLYTGFILLGKRTELCICWRQLAPMTKIMAVLRSSDWKKRGIYTFDEKPEHMSTNSRFPELIFICLCQGFWHIYKTKAYSASPIWQSSPAYFFPRSPFTSREWGHREVQPYNCKLGESIAAYNQLFGSWWRFFISINLLLKIILN